jgi:hypothetical protein
MRRVFTIILILVFSLPLIQRQWSSVIPDYSLNGYNAPTPKPIFSFHDLLEGKYQDDLTAYLQDNVGFKGYLIALKNQIDYSLFQTLHYTIELGRDGQLFYWNHIDAHCGHLTLSDDSLSRKMMECKKLQEFLDSAHIPVVYVLAPGKPAFYEDKLPKKFLNKCSNDNDYNHVLSRLNENQLEHLDFNKWFQSMRTSSPYPLFPKLGIHWSFYGACVAMDSLVKYIEHKDRIDLPNYVQDSFKITDQPYKIDKDLWSLLNVLLPMASDSLAYPSYAFTFDSTKQRKAKVLIIGDSFNWNLIDTKIPAAVFSSDSRFWFYKRELYDLSGKLITNNETEVNYYDLLKGTDMVIFLSTEVLNHRMDFGFSQGLLNSSTSIDGLIKNKQRGF